MWKVLRLKMNNFGSYREQELVIKEGTHLIQGINYDKWEDQNKIQPSNGSGKSFLGEAIYFCISGLPLRKVNIKECIYDEELKAQIALTLFNTISEETFEIEREVVTSGTNIINIYLNNEQIKCSSSTDYNNKILEILGIPKEHLSYYFVQKDSFQNFFTLSDRAKKDLIAQISGAKKIDEIKKFIQEDIKKFEIDFRGVEIELSKIEGQIKVYEDLEKGGGEEDFNLKKEQRIKSLKNKVDELKMDLFQNGVDLNGLYSHTERLQIEIEELGVSINQMELSTTTLKANLEESNSRIKSLRDEDFNLSLDFQKIEKEYQTCRQEIGSKKIKIENLLTCPKCNHTYSFQEPSLNIQELEKEIKDQESKLDEIHDNKEKILILTEGKREEISIEEIKNEGLQKDVKKCDWDIFTLNGEVRNKKKEIDLNKKQIVTWEKEANDIEERIGKTEYDLQIISKEVYQTDNSNKKKIDTLLKFKLEKEEEKLELESYIYTLKLWDGRFSSFYSSICNKYLQSLEDITNWFLEQLQSNSKISIEGYKTLGDGKTVREEITTTIYRDEKSKNFFSFSNGERNKVILSSIFALKKILNLGNEKGGLDFLLLDEVVESIDESSLVLLLDAINNFGETIYLVTHNNLSIHYSNIILVGKRNNISTILN